jgi:hypothetical protein
MTLCGPDVPLIVTFVAKTKALAAQINQNFSALLTIHVFGEDFTALTNGVTTTFTLAFVGRAGSLRVYESGSRQRLATDYTENLDSNGNVVSFTMTIVPPAATQLLLDYQRANV